MSDKSSQELAIAELSSLYEISSILFLSSEDEILKEALRKATRLFGVRFFVLFDYGKNDVISSLGFRDPAKIKIKLNQNEPNQFHFSFKKLGNMELFMEKKYPVETRERRLLIMYARSLENALFNASNAKKREEAEKKLKESEIKYRNIFENTGTATIIIERNKLISLANSEFEKLSGYSKEELENKKRLTEFVVSDDMEMIENYHNIRREEFGKAPSHYEFRFIDKYKNIKNIFVTISLIPGTKNSLASLIDITDRIIAGDKIKKSLEEKEMLLKEIHHRVKNNLMVISSLLNMQSRYITDEKSLNIFKESQSRAKSMALIHEKLYRSSDLKRINFGEYIRTLSIDLFHSYVSDDIPITLDLNVDDLMLDINTTVPLGLIVNELVSNALKHAFPDGRGGKISIEFHKWNDKFLLMVKDDGVGFPDDLDFRNTGSLGLQLVNGLTDQIDGKLELDKSEGTSFKIIFKEMKM